MSKKLVSFNEDNEDVYKLLDAKANYSQYVCEAVRFYENYLENVRGDKACVLEKSSNLDNDIKHMKEVLIKKMDRIEKLVGNIVSVSGGGRKAIDAALERQILNEED